MALLNCKECDNSVSTQAKRCPKCGAKAPRKPIPRWALWVLFSGVIFWGLIFLAAYNAPSAPLTPEEQAAHAAEEVKATMRHAIYECGYSVKETLNDPDSAKFDYDNAAAIPRIKNDNAYWVVDLPLRAKNQFNAMVYVVFQCRVNKDNKDSWHTLSINRIG